MQDIMWPPFICCCECNLGNQTSHSLTKYCSPFALPLIRVFTRPMLRTIVNSDFMNFIDEKQRSRPNYRGNRHLKLHPDRTTKCILTWLENSARASYFEICWTGFLRSLQLGAYVTCACANIQSYRAMECKLGYTHSLTAVQPDQVGQRLATDTLKLVTDSSERHLKAF